MATAIYNLGDYVQLTKKRKGFIRFQGNVKGVGDCYGIELDAKDLKNGNDGSMEGKQYFSAKAGFGTFVTRKRIVSILKSASSSMSPEPIATSSNPIKNGSVRKNANKKKQTANKKRAKSPSKAKLKHTVTPRPHHSRQLNPKRSNNLSGTLT